MQLTKHHGLGNDFLIVLDEANGEPVAPSAALARHLCDRHTGVGADGLIHGARPAPGDVADVVFRLWNADGSEAEISGNGIRCLAQAVARHRHQQKADLVIGTVGGVRRAAVRPGDRPEDAEVEVEMGPVTDGPALVADATRPLPLAEARRATASVGNPHVVLLVDDPSGADLATVGPAYEHAAPGGLNVELIAPAGPDALDLVVWERGAGATQACGSGATAAAHVAHGWGLVGERVEVRMPGGAAVVTLVAGGTLLTGPATFVAHVEVPGA